MVAALPHPMRAKVQLAPAYIAEGQMSACASRKSGEKAIDENKVHSILRTGAHWNEVTNPLGRPHPLLARRVIFWFSSPLKVPPRWHLQTFVM
ncbi:hypothetical protein D918_08734 [Trichuris suis]|nr:hypothetical protein D918_08734 [Trichuris suis]